MTRKLFEKRVREIGNKEIESLLKTRWKLCNNWKSLTVYESGKRDIARIATGNNVLYEKSVNLLAAVLGI